MYFLERTNADVVNNRIVQKQYYEGRGKPVSYGKGEWGFDVCNSVIDGK